MSDAGRRSPEGRTPRADRRPVPREPREARERSPYYPEHAEPLRAPWDPEDEVESGRRRSVPGSRDHLPRQSALGRFVTTWGWRAYAIPVLLVLTALVVADVVRDPRGATDVGPVGDPSSQVDGAPAPIHADQVTDEGRLPDGGAYSETGAGTFRMLRGTTPRVGTPGSEQFTYTVEIEDGVDTAEFGGDDSIGRMVDATLGNPKSWTADGKVAFQRVDSGAPTFRVSLTSPMTVRGKCGYDIAVESSCFNPADERVYLNLSRWVRGAHSFQGDVGSYRQYLVNHEVGHAVGHPNHVPCGRNGDLAPIMMQQTFGVANKDIWQLDPQGVVPDDDKVCRYNAWPFPDGAKGGR